jgi:hypothetical protein
MVRLAWLSSWSSSPSGDPDDRTVAGVALNGLRRHAAAAIQLTRRRPWRPRQRVEAGANDQLRPRAVAIALAARPTLPAEFHERVGAALPVAARVILDRCHEFLQGAAERRAALGIEHAIEPHHAVLRLADVEVPALVRVVRFGEGPRGVDPVLEILGDGGELARVHRPGGL